MWMRERVEVLGVKYQTVYKKTNKNFTRRKTLNCFFYPLCRYYVEDSGSRLILATEELASKVHPLNREVS
jgi:hypothetical protein